MTDFYELWERTDIGRERLTQNHHYAVGSDESPEFVRIDEYNAAQPNIDSPEWDEWHRVKCRHLLGEARVARTGRGYTVFPEDEAINKAILGAANKVVPARINQETGLPCEAFRDLCNHLVAEGLHTYADGRTSTFYLTQKAIEYVKKLGTPTSASQQHLKPRTTK